MPKGIEIRYNAEATFGHSTRWTYFAQSNSKSYAIMLAKRLPKPARVRRVEKTIVWRSKDV